MQPYRIPKKQHLPPAEQPAADAAKQLRAAAADARHQLGMSRSEASLNVAGFGRARGPASQSRKERRKTRLNPATGKPYAAERHAAVRVEAISAAQEKWVADLRKEVLHAQKKAVSAESGARLDRAKLTQQGEELAGVKHELAQSQAEHERELRVVGGQLVSAEKAKLGMYYVSRDMYRAAVKVVQGRGPAAKHSLTPEEELAECSKRLRKGAAQQLVVMQFGSGGVMPYKQD